MKGKIICCFVAVLLQFLSARGQDNPCVDTTGISMLPGSECGQFYACYSGVLYKTVLCPEGRALNSTTQLCTVGAFDRCVASMTRAFQCPKDLERAFYPDYSLGCPTKNFFSCRYGEIETGQCPSGTVYDEGTDTCNAEARPTCGETIRCDTATTFAIYADYTSGCPPKGFFVCLAGTMFFNTCPEGLFYNEGVKNCDYARNIPCAQNVKH